MAKRNRPILYEVFGSQTRVKGRGSTPRGQASKKPAERRDAIRGSAKELRVSYELAAVIGLLTVVLGGTLYYFGWVRGNDPGSDATLSSQAVSGRKESPAGGAGSSTGSRDAQQVARVETYYTVRVFTASYASGATREQIGREKKRAEAVKVFLSSRGYKDVRAIPHPKTRSVVVYVGRVDSKSALESVTRQIRRLTLGGKKQFKDAYATRITIRR
jgi:hypothetical protein